MIKRTSLSVLRKRVVKTKESTDEARNKKRKKKAAKKKEVKPLVPNWGLESEDCGQTTEKVLSFYHVQAWLREGITKRISWSVTIPPNDKWWGGKQRFLAKKLLEAYDGELVEKAVNYLCDNWEEMTNGSGGRITGIPTIEFLWGGRDRIFPAAERGLSYVTIKYGGKNRPLDADEYREPDDDAIGHGW